MTDSTSPSSSPTLVRFVVIGAALGFLAVAFGAFGAHALKPVFEAAADSAKTRGWWETAVRYQMWHALLVIGVGALSGQAGSGHGNSSLLSAAGWLCVAGVVLFSGSLYVMTLTGLTWLGAVTPLGGLCFLGAWISVGLAVLRR